MAYVDLVSTGVTPVAGGSTYNFAYDTPISADGSPHITHMGFHINMTVGAGGIATSATLGRLISNFRIKVGSETVLNFDDPAPSADATTPSNLSVLAQKVGGIDASVATSPTTIEGQLTLPFGIDASRSHRVNVSITLLDESAYCTKSLVPASTEFNMIHYYGTSADATLYGSRQDFTLTNGAERAITTYGKTGWSMLGVVAINDSDADEISEVRVNNGAFRALSVQDWRVLDSTYLDGIRAEGAGTGVAIGTLAPSWVLMRLGFLFIDLKKLTAGANIDMTVTSTADTTYSFFPIWCAPIGQNTGAPVRQQQKTVSSTAYNVESQSSY
tara:strand:+ start:4058 stop:5044 length:987 start_codon:yes stop_codon:yes gene_type:complete